ncbi:MAG: ATP synthase F1 subunit epsilon [Bacteroidetes bacterium]|nr:ATP synthase F1 subunit epsilon [Bacteroidota bacterium]
MNLEILTPEKMVFEGTVELVKVPGTKGSFAILNMHAPIISTLEKGEVKVKKSENHEQIFTISGGVVEVRDNKIIILAESIIE